MKDIRPLNISELDNDDLSALHYRNYRDRKKKSKFTEALWTINETLRYDWDKVNDEFYIWLHYPGHQHIENNVFRVLRKKFMKKGIYMKNNWGGILVKRK